MNDYKPTFYNLEYRALFVEYMKRRMKMIEIMEAKEISEKIGENIKKYRNEIRNTDVQQ